MRVREGGLRGLGGGKEVALVLGPSMVLNAKKLLLISKVNK
jgi:hypothetical protein